LAGCSRQTLASTLWSPQTVKFIIIITGLPTARKKTSKEERRADKSQEREHSITQGRLFSACIEIFQTTKMQTRSRTLSQYFTGILTLSPLTIDQADISVTIDTNGHEQTFF
jgi:hypothetical protein